MMAPLGRNCWLWATCLVLCASAVPVSPARACRIPVFRYALERWNPSAYDVIVLERGPLGPPAQAIVDSLREAADRHKAPANLSVLVIDRDRPLEEQVVSDAVRQQLAAYQDETLPLMVVLYPEAGTQEAGEREVWKGPLDEENVRRLIDSPVRQQIADAILGGDSAVWVLIETGDAAADDAAEKALREANAHMESILQLPPQEELQAEEEYRADTAVDLRISFSVVRLSREDPAEALFLAMLLRSEPDLAEYNEPIAIPVFGRGRTYFALVGAGIHEGTIGDSCRFVCGDCSCQVKEENPGRDLLMAVDWDGRVTGSAMPEPELPPLTGIGALVGDGEPAVSEPVADAAGSVGSATDTQQPASAGDPGSAAEEGVVDAEGSTAEKAASGLAHSGDGPLPEETKFAPDGDRESESPFRRILILGAITVAILLLVLRALTRWSAQTV